MKKNWVSSFCAICILLVSCNKLQTVQHFKMPPYMRDFFNYNDGSKWHYHEISDTNIKETVTVTGHREGKAVWDAFDQEFFEYDMSSDRDSMFKLRAIADENDIARLSLFQRDTSFKTMISWYFVGGAFSSISGTGDSVILHPQFVVNSISYADVLEFVPAIPRHIKRLFLARHVGIVRKDMANGKVFLLKSYTLQ